MNSTEVRNMILLKAYELGSQKKLAAAIGVLESFLSDVLTWKREPVGKILIYFDLERHVSYHKRPRT